LNNKYKINASFDLELTIFNVGFLTSHKMKVLSKTENILSKIKKNMNLMKIIKKK
jgi:hypothetical protein